MSFMNPRRHFCTLFDKNYLGKGVVMLDTLKRHCPDATVHVLCMDESTHRLLDFLKLPGVLLLTLSEVEDEDLLRVKPGRSIAEYCWTLSAALCWHLFSARPEIETLTYLDADLMFFSDVEPIFEEIGPASIAVIEHRFTPQLAGSIAYGRFNVEWVGFRRTEVGLTCLKTWRDQCIDWCFSYLDNGRLGDQKYLDAWPDLYPNDLHIIQHVGAGVAPWNYPNYQYNLNCENITVNNKKLIFYHFHQFQILSGERFDYMSNAYSSGGPVPLVIYRRYESALSEVFARVRAFEPGFAGGVRPAGVIRARRMVQNFLPAGIKAFLRRIRIQMW